MSAGLKHASHRPPVAAPTTKSLYRPSNTTPRFAAPAIRIHRKHLICRPGSVSATGGCAQGGVDTCHSVAVFSITSSRYNISAGTKHIYGALRAATQEQQR